MHFFSQLKCKVLAGMFPWSLEEAWQMNGLSLSSALFLHSSENTGLIRPCSCLQTSCGFLLKWDESGITWPGTGRKGQEAVLHCVAPAFSMCFLWLFCSYSNMITLLNTYCSFTLCTAGPALGFFSWKMHPLS